MSNHWQTIFTLRIGWDPQDPNPYCVDVNGYPYEHGWLCRTPAMAIKAAEAALREKIEPLDTPPAPSAPSAGSPDAAEPPPMLHKAPDS